MFYPLAIFLNFLLFVSVSLILISFGARIISFFHFEFDSILLKFIFSFGLGFGIFGYILYIIGLLKLFYFWLIWILLILILIVSFKQLIFWLTNIWEKIKNFPFATLIKNKFLLLLIILVGLWLMIVFIATVSPVIEFDSRWYHLGEAKYYLENHRISINTFWKGTITPSIFWPSAFPRLAEIIFAVFLSFKAEIAAKLINLAFGLIGVLAIFDYSRRKFGPQAALIAAVSVLVVDPFFINSFYGYIDLIVFGFATVSFLAIFNWLEKDNLFHLILAAIFSGFVVSCKLNGLFILPIFILIIIANDLLFKRNIYRLFKDLSIYIVIAFIFSFGWYLDNKIHTGSFIYPYNHLQQTLGPQGNFLVKNIKIFIESVVFIFPLLMLFVAGLSRKYLKLSILLFFSFLIYFVLYVRSPINEPRYLLPGIFGLAVLAGAGYKKLIAYNRTVNLAIKIFVVLIILINLFLFFIQDKLYYAYIIGKKTRSQFLTQVIAPDWWSVYDYNGEIKKTIGSSKAILAGNAWHTYYVDFKAVHASLSGINFYEIKNTKELASKIKDAGYDYIIIKKGDFSSMLAFTSIPNQNISGPGINLDYNNYFEKVLDDPYALILIYKIK